jgi:excisionase family DNA binding protein
MARASLTLPVSVPPGHPDYTRETYSLAQAAAYLCVSATWVYREVAAGQLAHRRHGSGRNARITFSQADLDAWRQSRRVERRAATALGTSASARLQPLPIPARRRFQ